MVIPGDEKKTICCDLVEFLQHESGLLGSQEQLQENAGNESFETIKTLLVSIF